MKTTNIAGTVLCMLLAGCELEVYEDETHPPQFSHPPPSSTPFQPPSQPSAPVPQSQPSEPPVVSTQPLKIERFKELIIVDNTVLRDARARNDVEDAPWSLRTQFEWLASSKSDGARFTERWLEQWETVKNVGVNAAPVIPRPAVRELLIDPWNKSTSSSYGSTAQLSLANAPFRLIAIVNRLDLRTDICAGDAGELRYVYTAVTPGTEEPLALNVIVEVPYGASRSAHELARSWHVLAQIPFGNKFNAALETLTKDVLNSADRKAVRVRTNEFALGASQGLAWELREFQVRTQDASEELVQVPLASTPRADLAQNILDSELVSKKAAILKGSFELPENLRAGSAQIPTEKFKWQSAALPEPIRHAFSRETCNGCHGGEEEALPFQHIAPAATATGTTRISRFLHNPGGSWDELGRREESLLEILKEPCDTKPDSYGQ